MVIYLLGPLRRPDSLPFALLMGARTLRLVRRSLAWGNCVSLQWLLDRFPLAIRPSQPSDGKATKESITKAVTVNQPGHSEEDE